MTQANDKAQALAIGTHVPKLGSLLATLEAHKNSYPIQLFLAGNTAFRTPVRTNDVVAAGNWRLAQSPIQPVFIHAPYCINLCDPEGRQGLTCLINCLTLAELARFNGVVVHVGKSVKQPRDTAYNHMMQNLVTVLNACKLQYTQLLLETPAGQGTELLTSPQELAEFVLAVRKQLHDPDSLALCLDTCHVFAAGWQPMAYLERLQELDRLVALIHYNDSATELGSRVDRHASPGTGRIPAEQLQRVRAWANAQPVPVPLIVE
jgi:deoxyribonuclease-4